MHVCVYFFSIDPKAINSNGAYIADEDETHYLMRVKK